MATHELRRRTPAAAAASAHLSASAVFQMPSYTSHESRGAAPGSPGRSRRQQRGFGGDCPAFVSAQQPSRVDSDQSLLEMLTSTVACLQQKHMDLEALGCLEQSLWLKRRMFGADNSVVQRALRDVVLSYNAVAMQFLAQAQFDQCLAMLRKAEAITAPGNFRRCQALQILTFNNIGCCYRKLGQLKSALKYLKEAAQLGAACAHVKNLSITHLNLCAIQSQLGRHDLALEHAQAAIFHTQEELVSLETAASSGRRDEDADGVEELSGGVLDAKSREEKVVSLAVAYHNLAVELEFNGRGDASLQWYKKALQLVWTYRESNAALCASFKKIFFDAKHKLELQRSGGHRGARATAVTGRPSASSSSDRRKRPQSAHHASRSGGGEGSGGAPDLSYSANVASQCYKPVKPSVAGLQYASPPKGRTPADCAARRSFTAQATSSKAPRPASAKASSGSGSGSRQRPLSASASRPAASRSFGDSNAGVSIEAHWKRLEREFALEDAAGCASAVAPAANSRTVKRPQSAHATATSAHTAPSQRRDFGAFAADFSDLEGGDDDGCDVLDDDELSENEDDAHTEKSDDLADLLLRRDSASGVAEHRSSRGRRHHQALDAARHRQLELGADRGDEVDGSSTLSASGDDAAVSRLDEGGNDEGDLPNQRVSHMEYLRRMKRLAENIKDDLAGAPAPAAVLRPGSASRRAAPPSAHASPSKSAAKASGDSSAISSGSRDDEEGVATPRGSTSKVRERLERMRSASFQSLPAYDDDAESAQEPESSPSPTSEVVQPKAEEFVEVVVNERSASCATEHEFSVAELRLVRRAAAKRVQAFVRGERARAQVRRKRQELREREALALESRAPLTLSSDGIAGADEDAVEHLAASVIQTQFRKRFLDGHKLQSPPSSPPSTPSVDALDPLERSPDSRRRNSAAVRIQATLKGHATREIVSEHRAALLSRLYVERKHVEVALHQAMAMEQAFLEELAATKIQALARGRQSRMLTEASRIGENAAAERIQSCFRSHFRHCSRAGDVGVRSVAARTIQQSFRAYSHRQQSAHEAAMSEELSEVQHIAATSLQRFWRQIATRYRRELVLEEIEAATCIQALGRGHLARKSFQSLRDSSSQLGLSKPMSAFSISAALAVVDGVSDEDNDERSDRSSAANSSFLPVIVRGMYLNFVVSPSYAATRAQQAASFDADREGMEDLALSFGDLLLEFETCDDVSTACFALSAMRILVALEAESYLTLPTVVRVARAIEQRIHEHDGVWCADVQQAALWLLDAFHDLLLQPA